jgi:hypothetical protein
MKIEIETIEDNIIAQSNVSKEIYSFIAMLYLLA